MERRRIDLSKVDLEGLHDPKIQALKSVQPPADVPFKIGKLGHAVLVVRDIDASVQFYTQVLGFKVSDVYPVDHAPPGQDTTLADPEPLTEIVQELQSESVRKAAPDYVFTPATEATFTK